MSDIEDTPVVATFYCPSCEPARDPLKEILSVHWCDEHRPEFEGQDDDQAIFRTTLQSTVGEAEAETNRPWCELLHRTLNPSKRGQRAPRPRRPSRPSRSRANDG